MAGVDNPHARVGTMDQATPPNQRRFRRYDVKLPGRVKPREPRETPPPPELEVETQDVSRGGMFFTASVGLNVGTAIDFELDLPARVEQSPAVIRCRGTITRVVPQDGGRMGIGATIEHYKISSLSKASKH